MSFVSGQEFFQQSNHNTDPMIPILSQRHSDTGWPYEESSSAFFSAASCSRFVGNEMHLVAQQLHALKEASFEDHLNALPLLLPLIENPDDHIRMNVVGLVGTLGNHAPLSFFLVALSDAYWDVRAAAAQALGDRNPLPLQEMLHALKNEQDMTVREALIRSIGKHPSRIPLRLFVNLLFSDPDWLVREAVAWALGQRGADMPVAALCQSLHTDVDELVRAAAARALGLSCHADAEAALYKALEYDDEEEVQEAIVWALQYRDEETRGLPYRKQQDSHLFGGSGDARPVWLLEENVHQEPLWWTITRFLSEKQGYVHRNQLLHTSHGDVLLINCMYQAAEQSLQEALFPLLKDPRMIEPLEAAMQGEDDMVRTALVQALQDGEIRHGSDIFLISLSVGVPDEGGVKPSPLRIIVTGVNCHRVREDDSSVINSVVDVLAGTLPTLFVPQCRPSLSQVRVWHQLDFDLLMQQCAAS